MSTAAEARAAAIEATTVARLSTLWNTLYDIRKGCKDEAYVARLTKALRALDAMDVAIETIAEMAARHAAEVTA